MTQDEKKPPVSQVPKTKEELEDEEEMKRASLMNPHVPCGKEEDRLGK